MMLYDCFVRVHSVITDHTQAVFVTHNRYVTMQHCSLALITRVCVSSCTCNFVRTFAAALSLSLRNSEWKHFFFLENEAHL